MARKLKSPLIALAVLPVWASLSAGCFIAPSPLSDVESEPSPQKESSLAVLTISDGPTYDFGAWAVNTSTDRTFTIQNTGEATATEVTGSGLAAPYSFKGGSYPGTGGTCTSSLAAASSCTIVVTFAPTAAGTSSDSIELNYHDGTKAGQATLALTGEAGFKIVSVSSSLANGTFAEGSLLSIQVTFTESVTVAGGTPTLNLAMEGLDGTASYASGSGSDTLTFEYTVQKGDFSADLDYEATGSLSAAGATLRNGAGVDADLTLPTPGASGSLGANKDILVDAASPTLFSRHTYTDTSVDLSWSDNARTESGYELEYCSGTGCSFSGTVISLPAGSTNHKHESLSANTAYRYRIRAVFPSGQRSQWAADTIELTTGVIPVQSWVTDGIVRAIVRSGNTTYIAGEFTRVGPVTKRGALLDPTTGFLHSGKPLLEFNGVVRAAVPDGAGGYYVAGDFTQVQGQTRNRLARILSDGTLSPWNPDANNSVRALAFDGSTLYIGGYFSTVGGLTRSRIAAIQTDANGEAVITSWNPIANNTVEALVVSGGTVYAGGSFTSIGGSARNRLAAIETDGTGNAVIAAWNPDASGTVWALAVDGATVYAGGQFTSMGGLIRNRIAAIETDGFGAAVITAWDPNSNNNIYALAANAGTVYAGGSFTSIGGVSRARLAAIETDGTGNAVITTWNPGVSGPGYRDLDIRALAVSAGTVYAGGQFALVGGQSRRGLVAIETDGSGNAVIASLNPLANTYVYTVAVSGDSIFAGGNFGFIGGTATRNRIAALDSGTGEVTSWNPDANGSVYALAVTDGTVYAGGQFTSMGGLTRNRIAAIETDSNGAAVITGWDPNIANNSVETLAVHARTVYVGGTFFTIGGVTRNRLASLETDGSGNAVLTSWHPDANSTVRALAINAGTVYAGGNFTTVGGLTRNRLAAINTDDNGNAVVAAWDPNAGSTVQSLAVNDGTVYVGGWFTSVGGITRNYIAAIETDGSGAAVVTPWNPTANNTVYSLTVGAGAVYASGTFLQMGGATRYKAARIETDGSGNAVVTAWNPHVLNDGYISVPTYAISASGTTVHVGGQFDWIGSGSASKPQPNLGVIDASTGALVP